MLSSRCVTDDTHLHIFSLQRFFNKNFKELVCVSCQMLWCTQLPPIIFDRCIEQHTVVSLTVHDCKQYDGYMRIPCSSITHSNFSIISRKQFTVQQPFMKTAIEGKPLKKSQWNKAIKAKDCTGYKTGCFGHGNVRWQVCFLLRTNHCSEAIEGRTGWQV